MQKVAQTTGPHPLWVFAQACLFPPTSRQGHGTGCVCGWESCGVHWPACLLLPTPTHSCLFSGRPLMVASHATDSLTASSARANPQAHVASAVPVSEGVREGSHGGGGVGWLAVAPCGWMEERWFVGGIGCLPPSPTQRLT